MSSPHLIRLRGPWLCWGDSAEGHEAAVTVDCRDEDGLSRLNPGPDRFVFGRRFHRPTGLDAQSVVHLVMTTSVALAVASLNSLELGSLGAGLHRFEIQDRLEPTNQLKIEVAARLIPEFGGLPDLFRTHLEIV